jgi:acetyl esterase/lipase
MSLQLFLIDKVLRHQMKRRFRRNPDAMKLRAMMATMARHPSKVPAQVEVTATRLGEVPTELLTPANADATRAFLYLHGGAFVGGSPVTHRALTWRLAAGTGMPVHALDYRLAPEHPFPAALTDAVAAYTALLDRGVAPGHIAIGGDSAGGNLTLATALKLKSLGIAQPGALVCLSPATELMTRLPSHETNAESDAMFVPALIDSVRRHYCDGIDASNPLISPLRGDVTGFPPTLIQCSDIEMLRDDSVQMGMRLRAAGVPVVLEAWPAVFHVWQLMADQLPEARTAIETIVAFVRKHV